MKLHRGRWWNYTEEGDVTQRKAYTEEGDVTYRKVMKLHRGWWWNYTEDGDEITQRKVMLHRGRWWNHTEEGDEITQRMVMKLHRGRWCYTEDGDVTQRKVMKLYRGWWWNYTEEGDVTYRWCTQRRWCYTQMVYTGLELQTRRGSLGALSLIAPHKQKQLLGSIRACSLTRQSLRVLFLVTLHRHSKHANSTSQEQNASRVQATSSLR